MNRAREEVVGVERLVQVGLSLKSNMAKLLMLGQLLKTTLINRKERWRQFQKLITARARIQFFYLLSERGFRGRLMASHKQKSLELHVRMSPALTNSCIKAEMLPSD